MICYMHGILKKRCHFRLLDDYRWNLHACTSKARESFHQLSVGMILLAKRVSCQMATHGI